MFSKTVTILIFINQFMCFKCFTFHNDNECISEKEQALNVEFYQKDESLYILVSERVSWFEATNICKYYEATLSTPNSTAKAKFLAHCLTDSNFRFEDYWLGAKYLEDRKVWVWVDNELVKNISIPGPWEKKTNGKNCLIIERTRHYTPMFAALSCYLPKPFICERPVGAETNKPLPSLPMKTITIGDSIFTIYHSRISWNKALAFCRSIGERLATIPNEDVVKALRGALVKARPTIENVWIGAQYQGNSWAWVSTGIKIPSTKDENGYPPWLDEDAGRTTEGCLLFDKHWASAYFVPERCQRRRDFICEQYVHFPEDVEINNETIKCKYKTKVMYIHLTNNNWTESQEFCTKSDGFLAEPSNYDEIKAIAVCLSNHPAEPKHVWIGGKYVGNQWRWVHSNTTISKTLPWCDDELDDESLYLNLDRSNHDIPWLYGLEGNRRQPFVCQADDITISTTTEGLKVLSKSCDACPCEQPAISMYYNNNTFVAFIFDIEKESVSEYCKYFGGEPFTSAHPKETISYVLAYLRLTIDLCDDCCTREMIEFWINDEADNPCTTINLESNDISQSPNCNTKKPFICHTTCNEIPKITNNENATVNCESLIAAGNIPYKSCKFACGPDYTIFGPDRFACDNYGWKIHTIENVNFMRFPDCHKTENTPRELIEVVNEINPEGFYFAVKENQKMDHGAWIAVRQFVNSMVQVFPEKNYFGLLTFSNTMKTRIPYSPINRCQVLEKLKNMKISQGAINTRYDLVLSEIQNELQRKKRLKETLIIFIVDKENTGEDYDDFVEQIHKSNKIFVVGISNNKFIFDLDMVASISSRYKLYTMKVTNYNALTKIALKLLEYRSPNINCVEDLFVLPGLITVVEDSKHLPKVDIDIIQKNGTFYVIKNFVSYKEAKGQCKEKYGGDLINEHTSHQLFTKMKQFHIEEFWIERGSECAVAIVFSQDFKEINCLTIYPFVCQIDCSVLPPINIGDNLENIEDEPHNFDCYQNDEVLWGPADLHCDLSKGGWVTLGQRKSPFPKCLNSSTFIEKFSQTLNIERNKNKAGILFVLDESKTVTQEDFQSQLEFVKDVAKLYPASHILPYGLITVSEDVILRIPYAVEDSCTFVKNLESVTLNSLGDLTNYKGAFELIDKQIMGYREEQANVVIFITNGLFIGELLEVKRVVSNLLRWDVQIIVLKIGQFESEVAPEIPTRDSEYNINLFTISSYSAFSEFSKKLFTEKNWTALNC